MITAESHRPKLALACAVIACGGLASFFALRGWIPSDDGIYAVIAEQLLHGMRLHHDIVESHPDGVHWLNALSLAAFGNKLASLRIIPALMAFIESLLAYRLLASRGPLIAFAGAVATVALGFAQIPGPYASHGALFFAFLAAYVLTETPSGARRHVLCGALIALTFLFRQPNAVFLAMGVAVYLFSSRAMAALIAAALIGYYFRFTNAIGFLLVGLWPLLYLGLKSGRSVLSARNMRRTLVELSGGQLLVFLPFAAYLSISGTAAGFYRDVLVGAAGVSALSHLKTASYLTYFLGFLNTLVNSSSLTAKLNGLYWGLLPPLPLIGGWLAVKKRRALPAPAVLALFYAPACLFNQIPFYLYTVLPLTALGLLSVPIEGPRIKKIALPALLLCLSIIAVVWQAGQPSTKSFADRVEGKRTALVKDTRLEKSGLWMGSEESGLQVKLVGRIRDITPAGGKIFVFPNDAELYYLSGRANPTPIWNTTISLRSEDEAGQLADTLLAARPALVIHHINTVYNTALEASLMGRLSGSYELFERVGDCEIYRERTR